MVNTSPTQRGRSAESVLVSKSFRATPGIRSARLWFPRAALTIWARILTNPLTPRKKNTGFIFRRFPPHNSNDYSAHIQPPMGSNTTSLAAWSSQTTAPPPLAQNHKSTLWPKKQMRLLACWSKESEGSQKRFLRQTEEFWGKQEF